MHVEPAPSWFALRPFRSASAAIAWLALTSLALLPGIAAGAATHILSADQDSYIKRDKPNDNFGNDSTLKIKESSSGRRALYRFDLSPVAPGATVTSATMFFYVDGKHDNPIRVHRITDAWFEGTVDWANTGNDFDPGSEGSFHPLVENVYESVDLTSLAQDWIDGTSANHGVMLIGTPDEGEVELTSREWSDPAERPYLEISVVDGADVAVTTTVDSPTASEGQTLTYTLTVTNQGPEAATGIQVADSLPVSLTHLADTPSQGSYDSGTGLWSVGSLASGLDATLILQAEVGPGTSGSRITNTATRTASAPLDAQPGNDVDSVDVIVASTSSVVLPPEAATLQRTHVEFRWLPVSGTTRYELEVVEDDGSPDPFASGPLVVSLELDSVAPRTSITTGLDFDREYAWRVRARLPVTLGWGPVRRFAIAPLPGSLPTFAVTLGPSTTPMEPGVTLFDVDTGFVAVDAAGVPVWFLDVVNGGDVRRLDNGRLLYKGSNRAFEANLDGVVLWASPDDPDLNPHHEVFPMPNGNVLTLVHEFQEVLRQGNLQTWRGDRLVEFHKRTNNVVWSWSSFANYSTLDFDEQQMQTPKPDGSYDWTHGNAVVYDPADDSVYYSARSLSRITRIDYATGQVVYHMGMDMVSGDADFGDDLFSFQHAPELLPNGNMMVFDNGSRRGGVVQTQATGVSKAIELSFDGTPPTSAQIVWEWTLPDYNRRVGDADRLPGGNTLVNSGVTHIQYEVDPAGDIVWTLETLGMIFPIYRSERIAALLVDAPGDADGDWDLDALDASAAQACFTGPGAAGLGFPCLLSDMDDDDDVDCDDWLAFLAGWTDPGTPPGFASCPVTACADGTDNDGDGLVDLADPGCTDGADDTETTSSFVCDDAADNDGDGLVDGADPGCDDPLDASERSALLVCDDGIDNDGDGWTDHPQDPGCSDSFWFREDPECQDGVDNGDADGLIDFDGGVSILGAGHPNVTAPDPQCLNKPWRNRERSGCGVGFELVCVLPLWGRLRGRHRRGVSRVDLDTA